jgi:hypothetical protein
MERMKRASSETIAAIVESEKLRDGGACDL